MSYADNPTISSVRFDSSWSNPQKFKSQSAQTEHDSAISVVMSTCSILRHLQIQTASRFLLLRIQQQYLGERLGNVSREVAAVLADLMDVKNLLLDECNVYDVGFKFVCELAEDTNHKREGFLIRILVYSLNSDLWTKKMFDILKTKKMKALKLIEN